MPILRGTAGSETDKAIHFKCIELQFPSGDKQELEFTGWFPLSQVTKITRSPHSNEDEIHISEWIAEKKGLYLELD